MSYANGFCLPSSFACYHETVTIDESIPELFERKIVASLKVVFLFSAYYIVDLARGLFLILWPLSVLVPRTSMIYGAHQALRSTM